METLLQDIRYAFRTLIKKPAFAVIAITALALGIGANTAIFSIVNGVLLQPLPFPEAERLTMIWETFLPSGQGTVSVPNLKDWKEQNAVFENISAYRTGSFNLQGSESPERISGVSASANFFDTLGMKPVMGRGFLAGEDQAGNNRVVVLSDELWKRNFGADPKIIDKTVTINGENFTVVGVMGAGVQFPRRTELWAPLVFTEQELSSRGSHIFFTLGRLKPNISIEQAKEQMNAVARRLEQQYPDTNTGRGVMLIGLQEQLVKNIRPTLLVLFAAVGFVLLISCTNVANLLLARAAARHRETAIRMALGAGRFRLIRQFLTEGITLSILGGLVGFLFAWWGMDLLLLLVGGFLPRANEVHIDSRVFGFTLLLSLLTGIVFGLAPAVQAAKTNLQDALKDGSKSTAGAGHARLRNGLVVMEIAFSFVLLVGAGLMMKSFLRLQQIDPGLKAENVVTMTISLPAEKYSTPEKAGGFHDLLLARVKSLPGVQNAGLINLLPFQSWGFNGNVDIEGKGPYQPGQEPIVEYRIIGAEYFRSLGIPLLKGRLFTDQDRMGAPAAVIINQTMAREIWPNEDPVGKRIKFDREWVPITGVVGDVKQAGLDGRVRMELYLPYAQVDATPFIRTMSLVVHASADPSNLISAIRREVLNIDPAQPVYNIQMMEKVIEESVSNQRVNMLLLGIFASLALILSAIGIYGVMSYLVEQRTNEIGIRMALGAESSDVLKLIIGKGMTLAAIGLTIGLAAAFALTRLMSSLLFDVSATDPAIFALIVILLSITALFACWVPARRAAKVDPIIALRCE